MIVEPDSVAIHPQCRQTITTTKTKRPTVAAQTTVKNLLSPIQFRIERSQLSSFIEILPSSRPSHRR